MTLPLFRAGDDPGPSFSELLRRLAVPGDPGAPSGPGLGGTGTSGVVGGVVGGAGVSGAGPGGSGPGVLGPLRHGTTVLAVRYADGVLMAGDRRATAGNEIAHRAIEKVQPADSYSGVAFAGAASAAIEMVKLFQTQLEHYEKVEGVTLSLEGKANQLGQMIRQNLPMAMQGFVVVPLFAGYDLRREVGRIFTYDPTGGPYEEDAFSTTGSGGRDARTAIKLAFREGLSRAEAVEVAIQALYEAADEDTATGGPDLVRGIFPTVATITAEGFTRVPEDEVAESFRALIERRTAEGRRQ